ncbi:MAG TPA: Co2+/Mg2+ efflux protein ApaG [Bacteroidota bacterium]|nr:Co2+/Mg2+ efflux protein ApaG [Bacteroidota bacterium]
MQSYVASTDDITVTVRPMYLDGQSNILARKFVFAYFIRIENNGKQRVQLMRRHWFIQNSDGELKEVEGEGVIGQQPTIPPGGAHEYSSFSVLETFEGTMEGTFLMERPDGEQFTVAIPRFVLRAASN